MRQSSRRIICIGNRCIASDSAGPLTYDQIASQPLPADVEVIDGGLAGLDLLRFVEGAERVVFVDAVADSECSGGVVVLDVDEVTSNADPAFGHIAGLGYLLRVAPSVLDCEMPEVFLVGIEGVPDQVTIELAAHASLSLAVEGVAPKMSGLPEAIR
ncbi:MAG: hydrogenase maturation protease [Proteobacteria bacterium]|nr:hydrogenase maturation protease [Pseudomonadota bacterium]